MLTKADGKEDMVLAKAELLIDRKLSWYGTVYELRRKELQRLSLRSYVRHPQTPRTDLIAWKASQ